jgi:hypothetical protein
VTSKSREPAAVAVNKEGNTPRLRPFLYHHDRNTSVLVISSNPLSPREPAGNALLNIETSVVRRPLAVMCEFKVKPVYNLRNNLLYLSHCDLYGVSSYIRLTWLN